MIYNEIKYVLGLMEGPPETETNTLQSLFNEDYVFKTFDNNAVELDPLSGIGIISPLYMALKDEEPLTEFDIITANNKYYRLSVALMLDPASDNTSPDNPLGQQTILSYNAENYGDFLWVYTIPGQNIIGVTLYGNEGVSENFVVHTNIVQYEMNLIDIIRLNDKLFIIVNNKLLAYRQITIPGINLENIAADTKYNLYIGTGNYLSPYNFSLVNGVILIATHIPIIESSNSIMKLHYKKNFNQLFSDVKAPINDELKAAGYYDYLLSPIMVDQPSYMVELTQSEIDNFITVDNSLLYNVTNDNLNLPPFSFNKFKYNFYIDRTSELPAVLFDTSGYNGVLLSITQGTLDIDYGGYTNGETIDISKVLNDGINTFEIYFTKSYTLYININNFQYSRTDVYGVSYSDSNINIGTSVNIYDTDFNPLYINNMSFYDNYNDDNALYDTLPDITDQYSFISESQLISINELFMTMTIIELPEYRKEITVMESKDSFVKNINSGFNNIHAISEGYPDYTLDLYKDNILLKTGIGKLLFNSSDYKNYVLKIRETGRIIKLPHLYCPYTGYLSGTINYDNTCGVTDLVVHCYRSDSHEFIGEFPVVNNKYRINYLYYDKQYDVILVDKNKAIENQVSSNRNPKIDIDVTVPDIISLWINYTDDFIYIQVNIPYTIEVGTTTIKTMVDTLTLYISDTPININDLNNYTSQPINFSLFNMHQHSIKIPNEKKLYSFCIKGQYKDTNSYSEVATLDTSKKLILTVETSQDDE